VKCDKSVGVGPIPIYVRLGLWTSFMNGTLT